MKRWTLIAALAILAVIALAPIGLVSANAHDGPAVVAALDGTVTDALAVAVVADLAALPAGNYKNALLLDESVHDASDFNYVSQMASRGSRPTGFKESEPRSRDVQCERVRA